MRLHQARLAASVVAAAALQCVPAAADGSRSSTAGAGKTEVLCATWYYSQWQAAALVSIAYDCGVRHCGLGSAVRAVLFAQHGIVVSGRLLPW
jgi:hypothetical protein